MHLDRLFGIAVSELILQESDVKNVLFASKTRLYTNVIKEEHSNRKLCADLKKTLHQFLTEFQKSLNSDLFIDAVLGYASYPARKYTLEFDGFRKVNAKNLDDRAAKLALRHFMHPKNLLKRIALVYDSDGYLCIDIDCALNMPSDFKDITNARLSGDKFDEVDSRLNAVHNAFLGLKLKLVHMVSGLMMARTGIAIDVVKDIVVVDHYGDQNRSGFRKYVVSLKERDPKQFELIWELHPEKLASE